jgi:hypothetical protein
VVSHISVKVPLLLDASLSLLARCGRQKWSGDQIRALSGRVRRKDNGRRLQRNRRLRSAVVRGFI